MVGTGRLLETLAQRRAGHDLSALLDRIPRTARLVTVDGPRPVPVAELGPGDRIVVAAGEVVPVDAGVTADASFDESALTGEPDPVTRRAGDTVRSGVVSVGQAVELVATASAEDSTYAGVVRLAEQAGSTASRRPGNLPSREPKPIRISTRASCWPRHWWIPWPKARWLVDRRVMSSRSGSGNRVGSQFAAGTETVTLSPARMSWPSSSMSSRAVRIGPTWITLR
ncbi:hypothetical protein C1701_21300 [Actinoalloteichus sp. AHMU CJ021]|nr:hypothetical protein C1701_21300 [Actinoalloteichus sp. AHMU CJ021]